MKKIHDKNIKLITMCATALVIVSVMKYGLCVSSLYAFICIVVTFCTAYLIYRYVKDDEKKAIGMMLVLGVATHIYSYIVGGSNNMIFIILSFTAMSSQYYSEKILLVTSIVQTVLMTICSFVNPSIIEGPNATISGALSKVILFVVVILVVKKAMSIGAEVSQNSNRMIEKLNKNSKQAIEVANDVNSIVIESNKNIEEIVVKSNDIENVSKKVDRMFNEMIDAFTKVNDIVVNMEEFMGKDKELTEEIKESYNEVSSIVKEGIGNIETTRQTMVNMETTITRALEKTNELVEYMKKIDAILEEINSVSNQTNLLSLNASIEAARAGEEGKGFAVVANEIRSLSEQSTEASDNIKIIIEKLNGIVKEVSSKINESSEISARGYVEMDEITEVLIQIANKSDNVEKVIDSEYELVGSINNEFSLIVNEMIGLFEYARMSLSRLNQIQEAIIAQNEDIHNLERKMSQVGVLSEQILK